MRLLITSLVDLKSSQHNRLHQFVKYFSQYHQITIISINDWWKKRQVNIEDAYFEDMLREVDIRYITKRKIPPILQEVLFPFFIRINDEYDVHIAYGTIMSGYYTAKILKSRNVPTIVDIADDNIGMIENSPQIPRFMRKIGVFMGKYFSTKLIDISRNVILTSMTLNDVYNIPVKKIVLIPNGVDTNLFRKLSPDKTKFGLSDSFIIGFVGALREWVDLKPVFLAIRNLRKIINIKMIVVGKEGLFLENKRLAEEYDVSENVIFAGHVPYKDIPEFIAMMDVCVIPFKLDSVSINSLPLKLFEYMACGKPVISTRLPNIEMLAKNNVIYADNDQEFENAILELYAHPTEITKLSINGIEIAKSNSWERILNKFNHILIEEYK